MKIVRWILGLVAIAAVLALILLRPLPFLFYQDLPHLAFMGRALHIIILASFLCLYRVMRGPTSADRIVAVDILGIMIVGYAPS